MNLFITQNLLSNLAVIDPGPFFVISLFPYLVFLYWTNKTHLIPRIAKIGFGMTLFFVFMTIIFSIVAKVLYGEELTNIDFLHGAAESFLALSDALIVFGFFNLMIEKEVNNS